MRIDRTIVTLCALWVACAGAWGQDESRSARERDLLVSLDVGYSTAFRESSWVPVTVDIVNEQRDFDGYIEVRTFNYSNEQQSPSYRLAAQCPKDSRKQYTLYAFLQGTDRVEAWLFEKGRRATDAPSYMQVRPIEKDDLLILVLDDDPFNYGFLYAAVQREGKAVRLSRHGLPTSDLGRLPDIPQAYEAFDAVVMGDIEPDRIAARHRALLADYVAQGGTLIVSLGENAADYRGSWLAPLLGAEIGQTTLTTEGDLASLVPADLRDGLRADRQAEVATLTPTTDARAVGNGGVLATQLAYGAGTVYAVAIDATSRALQDMPGYQALWRTMIRDGAQTDGELELNIDAFANTLSQNLPNLSGVTIRPLGWVMSYLLLYLGVAVVGNWLFWNRLKRREMAWLCLIGFSIAFTAYAMLFGRSGNLREAKQHNAAIVELEPGESRARFNLLTGILTSRTRSFSGTVTGEHTVVRDAASRSTVMNPFNGMAGDFANARPFAWDQADPARVEEFRIGASELRMMSVEGDFGIRGGIEGELTIDDDGIRGEFVDETGFALREPLLAVDGVLIPMTFSDGGLHVAATAAEIASLRANSNAQDIEYLMWNARRDPVQAWNGIRTSLFIDDSFQMRFDMPAYVIAWSDDALSGAGFTPDQPMTSVDSRTLLAARVDLVDVRARTANTPVSVELGGRWYRSRAAPPMRYQQPIKQNAPGSVRVRVPTSSVEQTDGDLVVDLYWGVEHKEYQLILARRINQPLAEEEDVAWHRGHMVAQEAAGIGSLTTRTTYRIPEWRSYLDADEPIVTLGVTTWREEEEDSTRRLREAGIQTWAEYSAVARIERTGPAQAGDDEGEWPQWR